MKIRVLVSYKESVLDPQGQTVRNSLHTLGYDFIQNVRQGKVFELDIDDLPREKMELLITEIAGKVLANPIIERFEWEILEKSGERHP